MRLDAPVMIAVVCTVAHSTALSHAYGMSPGPAAVGLVALVGPGVGTFFVPGLGLWPAGVLLSVYFLYLLGTLGQSAQDFDRRVRMETNLLDAASKEQRAQASRESAMRLRQRILDTIPIPVFYKDAARAYLGCNDAHARFLGVTRDAVVGKTVHDLSPPELARIYDERDLELLRQPGSQVYEAEVDCRPLGEKRLVVFHKATFEATGGGVGGIVGALVDVTERTRAERHREEMIAELRLALEKVRKLSGLLPICANCKKIRDDKGYWNQIESYIHAHSEAEFSHGICPDCLEKLYPDLDDVDAG
jgi:PAS domain S-box-containing protein